MLMNSTESKTCCMGYSNIFLWKIVSSNCKLYFYCINNMAEYEECSMRVQMVYDMKIKKLQVYGDSLLVIHLLNRE